jgi:D-alanine-D-alanine ligase
MKRDKAKQHIAVLMGGLSAEREVSLSSAAGIIKNLQGLGYQVTPIDMDRDVAEVLARVKPDIVFNALHGTYGEDGCVQGLLEILGIPYTHSGVLASAIGMDKPKAKALFESNGILCPQGRILHRTEVLQEDPLPRPYVIKPLSEGSSIGVHVIMEGDNFDIRDYDWAYGDAVILERYIPGKEIQVAVVGNRAIGAIEIRPKGRFYDYEAKYTDGKADHIMPAPISSEAYHEVLALALKVHQLLGCKSVSRVDFRYDDTPGGDGRFYLLEINTHPGMTPLSLVPEIAAYAGISFPELLEMIIRDARCGA